MKKQIAHHQQGYTLVEALTALLIASAAIAGLSFSVTNAVRSGTSASHSSIVAMAHQSAFVHLRNYFGSLDSVPDSYQFRTATIDAASNLTFVDTEINDITIKLERMLSDFQSVVECQLHDSFTCEVCFEWYEHAQTYRQRNLRIRNLTAINRSACQLQIV